MEDCAVGAGEAGQRDRVHGQAVGRQYDAFACLIELVARKASLADPRCTITQASRGLLTLVALKTIPLLAQLTSLRREVINQAQGILRQAVALIETELIILTRSAAIGIVHTQPPILDAIVIGIQHIVQIAGRTTTPIQGEHIAVDVVGLYELHAEPLRDEVVVIAEVAVDAVGGDEAVRELHR